MMIPTLWLITSVKYAALGKELLTCFLVNVSSVNFAGKQLWGR